MHRPVKAGFAAVIDEIGRCEIACQELDPLLEQPGSCVRAEAWMLVVQGRSEMLCPACVDREDVALSKFGTAALEVGGFDHLVSFGLDVLDNAWTLEPLKRDRCHVRGVFKEMQRRIDVGACMRDHVNLGDVERVGGKRTDLSEARLWKNRCAWHVGPEFVREVDPLSYGSAGADPWKLDPAEPARR